MKRIILSLIYLTTYFTTTFAQNVGVGETSPASKLSVKGNLSVGSSYSTTAAPSNGAIFQGNVGIGTISPVQKLDVNGTTRTTNFQMTNGATNTYIMQTDGSGNASWVNPTAVAAQNMYNTDGSLTGNRTVTMSANNLTFSSTTGNFIFNPSSTGNVGIGTTAPGSNLVVAAAATNNGVLKIGSTTTNAGDQWWLGFDHAVSSSSSTSADANDRARIGVNIKNGGAGRLFFTTGIAGSQSERMRIDESGNVGIGTTAPSNQFSVNNGMNIDQASTNNGSLANNTSTGNGLTFGGVSGEGIASNRANNTVGQNYFGLDFYTSSTRRLSITNAGNVGIGTSSPSNQFTVNNGMNIDQANTNNGTIANSSSTGNGLIFGTASGEGIASNRANSTAGQNQYGLDFYTNSTRRVSITQSGSVGIGTASPSGTFDVIVNNGAFRVYNNSVGTGSIAKTVLVGGVTGTSAASPQIRFSGIGSGFMDIGQDSSANFVVEGNDSSRLVVQNGGNVGIGTSSPSQKLEVSGTTKTTNFQMTNGATNTYLLQTDGSGNASWVNPTAVAVQNMYNTDGSLTGNRTVTMGANNLTFSSTTGNLIFNPSSGGHVGIGLPNPSYALHIKDTGTVGSSYSTVLFAQNATGYQDALNVRLKDDITDIAADNAVGGINTNLTFSTNPAAGAGVLTERMRIQFDGKVGIGTTAADNQLTVANGLTIDQVATNNGTIGSSISTGNGLIFGTASGEGIASNRANSTAGQNQYGLDFYTNYVRRISITQSGNLGVGTTSPSTDLAFGGDAARSIALERSTGTAGFGLTIQAGGAKSGTTDQNGGDLTLSGGITTGNGNAVSPGSKIVFKTATPLGSSSSADQTPSEKMRITPAGRVGINTTSPISLLANTGINIVGNDGQGVNANSLTWTQAQSGYTGAFYNSASGASAQGVAVKITGTANSNRLLDLSTGGSQATAGTSVMVVTGDGRVGIGVTNPSYPIDISSTVTSSISSYGYLGGSGSGFGSGSSGSVPVSIHSSGRIFSAEVDVASDKRIKTNINSVVSASMLNKANELRVVNYNYIDKLSKGTNSKTGFIAQEVEVVMPNAINKATDVIPNVFAPAEKVRLNNNELSITTAAVHNFAIGDEVLLYDKDNKPYHVTVAAVPNQKTFLVNNWTEKVESIFVYGKKVNDFRAVDFDQITAMAIGAIQELTKELKDLKAENARLRTNDSEQTNLIKTMKAQIDVINERLNITTGK